MHSLLIYVLITLKVDSTVEMGVYIVFIPIPV